MCRSRQLRGLAARRSRLPPDAEPDPRSRRSAPRLTGRSAGGRGDVGSGGLIGRRARPHRMGAHRSSGMSAQTQLLALRHRGTEGWGETLGVPSRRGCTRRWGEWGSARNAGSWRTRIDESELRLAHHAPDVNPVNAIPTTAEPAVFAYVIVQERFVDVVVLKRTIIYG